MDYAQTLWLYALLVFGIIAVPGMDMLLVTTNAATGGRVAGLAATGGILVAGAYHTLWGAIGTRLLLALPAGVFTALQLAGAAYIGWIGFSLIQSTLRVEGANGARPRPPRTAFRQGVITAVLNPKAYIFILSVFPQFLSPRFGPIWPQAVVLGAITLSFQAAIYGGLALLVSAGRERFVTRPGMAASAGRLGGAIFLLVAALTAAHALA